MAGKLVAAAALLLLPGAAQAQQNAIGIAPVTLTEPSYVFDTAEQHGIRVTPLVRELRRPFAIAFLPDGDLLVAERGWDLRIVRGATTADARLDPQPVAGMPRPAEPMFSVGLQDIALHPGFAANRWLYWTYNEPAARPEGDPGPPQQRSARLTLMRGKLADGRVSQVETLFQGGVSSALGSRIAFGTDGTLYLTAGGAYGEVAQDLATIYGKVLRLNADGSIPPDNPFVGRADAHPAIYSYGHRDHHGLMVTDAGAVLNAEHGMNGGDEVNLIRPGANYGWPAFTYSRQYDGAQGSEQPASPGIERPLILWSPSIAPSGLMIYRGDRFPAWKGNLFVGSARRGEVPFTGGLERVVLGAGLGDVRRETLLGELHQRVRDFAEGPDGLIYVLTDGNENAVLRIEPTAL
ncbi:MAG TPA: PQQ-dependent sugar dehydrogenase [Croceibacterium sp.]|nr:PQQ-dependent sugar dehydrogenase [Croceibacterium sp.]